MSQHSRSQFYLKVVGIPEAVSREHRALFLSRCPTFVYRPLVLSHAPPLVTSTPSPVQKKLPVNVLPPRPVINLGVSLWCESVPTQTAEFLCGRSLF